MIRTLAAILALTLAFPLAAAAAPVAIKLEIQETVDGKPSRDTPITFTIRKKLREAGFVAWTEKPLRQDEFDKRQREKGLKAGTGPAAPSPTADVNDLRPAPDLVVRGTIALVSTPVTFFVGNLATKVTATATLSIRAPGGKELATVVERDEWTKARADEALDASIRRIQAWVAAALLKAEPIRSRLSEPARKAAGEWVAETETKRRETPPAPPPPPAAPK